MSDDPAPGPILEAVRNGDTSFAAAVRAIHAGDAAELARLLDAEPRLLCERVLGPDAHRVAMRFQYFLDPMLFWFVANNPNLVAAMPANVVEIAEVMIARGVASEDLNYTLELTMTSRPLREQGLQLPLMRALVDAGAVVSRDAILSTAGHRELGALRALVADGLAVTAPIAAAFGDSDVLRTLLPSASTNDVQAAFGIAVINGHTGAAALALDAGARVNAFLPVHAHSTALHQAADRDDPELIALLLARGAHRDTRDTLWDGTALDWALHQGRDKARAALEPAT